MLCDRIDEEDTLSSHCGLSRDRWLGLLGDVRATLVDMLNAPMHLTISEMESAMLACRVVPDEVRHRFIAHQHRCKEIWDSQHQCNPLAVGATAPPYRIPVGTWGSMNADRMNSGLPWLTADDFEKLSDDERESLCPPSETDTMPEDCGVQLEPAYDDGEETSPTLSSVRSTNLLPPYVAGNFVVPNWLARSSVCAVCGRGDRRTLGSNGVLEVVASYKGTKISASGEQPDQHDLTAILGVVALAQRLGGRVADSISLGTREVLREIERSASGSTNRRWLKASLTRWSEFQLRIEIGQVLFSGSLISELNIDDVSGKLVIRLHPDLPVLFGAGMWTRFPVAHRSQLKEKPLALWLQAFFATHSQPEGMRVDNLCKWSGSGTDDIHGFTRMLDKALASCIAASSAGSGEIISRSFVGVLVNVTKIPSAAQRRYLDRKRSQ
jgi:hypothetical protein